MRFDAGPTGTIAARSARGGALLLAAQGGQLLASVATGIVLARLLTPDDFGIFAMVVSLAAFVSSFSDFGLGMASLQRSELDHEDLSRLFWLNAKLCAFTFLFMILMAPVLVRFYGEPRLVWVTFVMAAVLVVQALGVQHRAVLNRRMMYGRLTALEVAAAIAGAVAGITSAWLGAAYWALVIQHATLIAAQTAGLWLFGGWRPAARARTSPTPDRGSVVDAAAPGGPAATAPASPDRAAGMRDLTSYGREYTIYRVIHQVGFNLDRVLVGYFRGATAMGLYDNAFRWSRYPVRQVFTPLLNVAVGGLSRLQSDTAAFRNAFRKGALPVYTLVLPVLAFFVAEPRVVILTLLGGQWTAAIPLFRVLCAGAFASSLIMATNWIYLSEAGTRRQLRWILVQTPVTIAAVATGVHWGALGVAIGFATAMWLLLVPAIGYCLRGSRLSVDDFVAAVWRPVVASAVAAALVAFAPAILEEAAPLAALLARALAFGLAYALTWVGLPGGRGALRDLRRLGTLLATPHTAGS